MTETSQDHSQETRHTVVVPGSIDMVRLLGPGDDHLALIERSFDLRVHVRGNRITLEGEPGEVALARKKFDGSILRADGGRDRMLWQTLYHCRRQEGRWKISGFTGYLPNPMG